MLVQIKSICNFVDVCACEEIVDDLIGNPEQKNRKNNTREKHECYASTAS